VNGVSKRKKPGVAGRFGARYGFTLRKRLAEVEAKVRRSYPCPSCGAERVERVSTAIWQCKRCGVKFAGGAYSATVTGTQPAASRGRF
jgi:large subunit ribosomal protein L37Ae